MLLFAKLMLQHLSVFWFLGIINFRPKSPKRTFSQKGGYKPVLSVTNSGIPGVRFPDEWGSSDETG